MCTSHILTKRIPKRSETAESELKSTNRKLGSR